MAPLSLAQLFSPGPVWDLDGFNRLVLAYQDQIYTLAFHLLGSEAAACEAVDCALRAAYRQKDEAAGFQLQAMRQALRACLNHRRGLCGSPWLRARAGGLSNREKVALILVDCLQLSYSDAAAVMDEPRERLAALVAGARRAIHQAQNGDHER